ncbi:MAG TPA: thioredoxin domain-containing protein [Kofleriaceae bacterium]|jgi:protein-disulfide isomerase|nr:thioredoxin domain-containing protein [Kofleriaceae bacterium]
MRIITSLALASAIAALGACEQPSRLDKVTSKAAAPGASAPADKAADAPSGTKIDRSGSVEQQLARLQDAYDKNAEAMGFLNQVYGQQKAQQQAQDRNEPAEDAMFAVNVTEDIKAGQVDGPPTAPVTIVKAFDFACPYCQRTASTMNELVKEYGGKVRVVYANMLIHPPAKPAHLASCAAAKQGKYVAFKDAFWDKGFGPYAASGGKDAASLGEDNILKIAEGLGLDTAKLKADMASPECEKRIESDMAELQKWHVNATPTFFINGRDINGALPKDAFKRVIDEELAKVEKSGVSGGDYYDKIVLAQGEKQFRSKVDPKPH